MPTVCYNKANYVRFIMASTRRLKTAYKSSTPTKKKTKRVAANKTKKKGATA